MYNYTDTIIYNKTLGEGQNPVVSGEIANVCKKDTDTEERISKEGIAVKIFNPINQLKKNFGESNEKNDVNDKKNDVNDKKKRYNNNLTKMYLDYIDSPFKYGGKHEKTPGGFIKMIKDEEEKQIRQARQERKILNKFPHLCVHNKDGKKNIMYVERTAYFATSSDKSKLPAYQTITYKEMHVLMKYIEGEDLQKFLVKIQKEEKTISFKESCKILMAILVAYKQQFADERILHRDVKLENIMIDDKDKNFKITFIDVADSINLPPNEEYINSPNLIGTREYALPEIQNPPPGNKFFTYSIYNDKYALGIIAGFLFNKLYEQGKFLLDDKKIKKYGIDTLVDNLRRKKSAREANTVLENAIKTLESAIELETKEIETIKSQSYQAPILNSYKGCNERSYNNFTDDDPPRQNSFSVGSGSLSD